MVQPGLWRPEGFVGTGTQCVCRATRGLGREGAQKWEVVSKELHVQSQGHLGCPGTGSEGHLHWQCPWALGTLKFPSLSQTSESLWNDFQDREQHSGKTPITKWSNAGNKRQGSPRPTTPPV